MLRQIIRKDWALLWPLVLLLTALQLGYGIAVYKLGFFGLNPVFGELVRLLEAASLIGLLTLAVAVVHEDPIPGLDQDWLIRPIRRTDLLWAKLSFVALTISLPMFAVDLGHELVMGFPALPSFVDALYKGVYVFLCLIVPAMALASAARGTSDLLLLVAGLVVLYAVSLWGSSALFGAEYCPTCDTSVSWLQHVIRHISVLAGSIAILIMQYYRRLTRGARLVAAAGVVLLVLVQLPWSTAFAIQTRLSAAPERAAAVRIEIDGGSQDVPARSTNESSRPNVAQRTTQALLHGDVNGALASLRTIVRPEDPSVVVTIPFRVTGTTDDEIVLLDHVVYALTDGRGTVFYRGTPADRSALALLPDPADAGTATPKTPELYQAVQIPGVAYRDARRVPVHLTADYSLTLVRRIAEHKMAAADGEIRVADLGLCRSRLEANEVRLRCKQIGRVPFCYSATVYAPDGRHNPPVLDCSGDYRPFIPSPTYILGSAGSELPTRDPFGLAHYPVDPARQPGAYILLQVYAAQAHFNRTAVSPVHLTELGRDTPRANSP